MCFDKEYSTKRCALVGVVRGSIDIRDLRIIVRSPQRACSQFLVCLRRVTKDNQKARTATLISKMLLMVTD
jgi:hypothetical protein